MFVTVCETETSASPETNVSSSVKKSNEVSPPVCSKMICTPWRLKTSRVEFSVAPKVEAKEPKKVALAYQ